jgi:protein-tyrosine kinase
MNKNKNEQPPATITRLATVAGVAGGDEPRVFQSRLNDDEPVVDLVPIHERLKAAAMLVPGSKLGPDFSDEYRRIKRPLLSNAFGASASLVERGNLILITSSLPGEGKSYTAVNLALSIANERDHTVLLVDCDVVKKGISHMLGIANMPGLIDVLKNDASSIGDVMLRTDIPNLTVLSAGSQHEYVTELLASQRMSSLVNEMVSRYDDRIIIFDAPPLLPTPQTHVLAELVGQVVFVIEVGVTPQSVVEEAQLMIPTDKATGVVMNKSEGIFGRNGYYYGYSSKDSDKQG